MNQEIKALKSELFLLKLQFSERVEAVEYRLNALLEKDEKPHNEPSVVNTDIEETPVIKLLNEEKEYTSTPRPPSFITLFFQAIISSLFEWASPVTKAYQSYKNKGMLGIFVLTIVGITLTLAGFGYLMQLLIDQLGAGSKSLLMCIAALLVMGIGIGLKIKTGFGEFATAIVTLGILLSYSTIYFAGSVYGIIPDLVVLFLYLLVALTCHGLALWLDTKIVAGLGIIGIATMPILSNTIQIEPFYYLLSLVFVTASGLILAFRRNELWLAQLSLAFCIVALEWIIAIEGMVISVWLVNLFYLLFFAFITLTSFKAQIASEKVLILLAALVGSMVLLFFQSSELFSSQMSFSFALNAAVAGAVSFLFYKIRHNLTHFFILITALWAVLSVVSAVSDAYWGIAWAVEGLLLLYIGRKYEMTSVINQGQVLTALSLIYSWSALALYFPLPALISIDGWVLSIVIVAVIGIWLRLINDSFVFDERTQKQIKPILQLIEVMWGSILIIATLSIVVGNWAGMLIIVLQLALLFRARQCQQNSIEIFSAALILVPLYFIYSGVMMVDSYRFMALPLFSKLALISVFSQLWLWSAYYRKYQPNSSLKNIAESVRIFFYMLLPIFWLGSVIRRLDENALMVVWLSPLLALFIAEKIKHQLLIKEAKLLTIVSSVGLILLVAQLKPVYCVIALSGFIIFYGYAFYLDRRISNTKLYQFVCSWGVISLGLSIPSIIYFKIDSILIGGIFASLFWVTYFRLIGRGIVNVSEHFKRNEILITSVNGILVLSAWGGMEYNALFLIIPILFLISAIYKKESLFDKTKLGASFGQNGDLFIHSIGAVTYTILFTSLAEYRIDLLIAPALAVHGAFILFMKSRRTHTVKYSFILILLGIMKLALLDASNALLWQKVILFIGIGVFILGASFWYQKLISQYDDKHA